MPLPIRLAAEFPPDLTAIPLEDIDPYYQNKKVEKSKFPVMKAIKKTLITFFINNVSGMYYGHRVSKMEASLQSEKVDMK